MGSITTTFQDRSLGQGGGGAGRRYAVLGLSLGGSGATGTVRTFARGSVSSARSSLIGGEGFEAVATAVSEAGIEEVHYVPVDPSTFGSAASVAVALYGTGTGTITVTAAPIEQITVECVVAGGLLGAAKFRFRRGSGAWSATTTSAAGWGVGGYHVPDTYTKLVFTEGTGYDVTDTFTISTIGVITQTVNGGAGTGTIGSQTSSPVDFYYFPSVKIIDAGAIGTATYQYSLDAFDPTSATEASSKSWSGTLISPGGAGKVAIPNAGIFLTFAGTFTAGDIYYWRTTGPSAATSDYITALDILRADVTKSWEGAHLVGNTSASATAATRIASLQTEMDDAAASNQFAFAVVDCPSSESDATIAAAISGTEANRVVCVVGDVRMTSAGSRIIQRRNASHAFMARLMSVRPGIDAGWGRLGSLTRVVHLYRDETSAATKLGAYRLVVLGTRPGKGKLAYVGGGTSSTTGATTMAAGDSDFKWIVNRRVIDRAAEALIAAEQPWENQAVRIDATTGYIDDRDADRFDNEMESAVSTAVIATSDASAVDVQVNRTTNLISTSTAPVTLRVTPLGYFRAIENTVGFINPAFGRGA